MFVALLAALVVSLDGPRLVVGYTFRSPGGSEGGMLVDGARVSAVIIEPRSMVTLPVVIMNLHKRLPDLKVYLFHGGNKEYVKTQPDIKALADKGILAYRAIDESFLSKGQFEYPSGYNKFLVSPQLWESFQESHVLIFQCDTWVCPSASTLLPEFLKYDYVGATWEPGSRGGNGGFSLRKVSNMLDIVKSHKADWEAYDHNEDVFFSKFAGSVPSWEDEQRFSHEHWTDGQESIGLHQTWRFLKPWQIDFCSGVHEFAEKYYKQFDTQDMSKSHELVELWRSMQRTLSSFLQSQVSPNEPFAISFATALADIQEWQQSDLPHASKMLTLVKAFFFPTLSLAVGLGLMIFSTFSRAGLLFAFFGGQGFMKLFMKACLSSYVVSTPAHLVGFPAPFLVTAAQQVVGFITLSTGDCIMRQCGCTGVRSLILSSKSRYMILGSLAVAFTLNIGLNNLSLSLLDINVNMVLRSCTPAVSMLGDKLLCLCFPAVFASQQTASSWSKSLAVLMLVFGSANAVWSMSDVKAAQTQNFKFGVLVCVLSIIAWWLEIVLTGLLSAQHELNPASNVLWMGVPAACLLLIPAIAARHPSTWSPDWMTDFEVASVAARWSYSCFGLALFSGVVAMGYNVLLYTFIQQFSPTEVAVAATTNKVLLLLVIVGSGFSSLPEGARLFQFVFGFAITVLSMLWIAWATSRTVGKSAALSSGTKTGSLKQ